AVDRPRRLRYRCAENLARMSGEIADARQKSSFRGDAKHRTRNLEIPGLRFAHPGMTPSELLRCARHDGRRFRRPRLRGDDVEKLCFRKKKRATAARAWPGCAAG